MTNKKVPKNNERLDDEDIIDKERAEELAQALKRVAQKIGGQVLDSNPGLDKKH